MPLRNLAWLLIVPGFVLLGLVVGSSAPPPDKDYRLVRQIVDVLAEVDANYVKELDDETRQKLVEDMINGGLRELDPHSAYLNAEKLRQFESDTEGRYGGVGMVLGVDRPTRQLKVDHLMPGTPAYQAGLVADDLIVRIDGAAVAPLPEKYTDQDARAAIEAARKRITGEVGTPVTLTIRRPGRTPPEQDVTLTRAKIEIHPVVGVARRADDPGKWEWFADKEHKIAVIRIQTFNEITAKEVREAVGEVEAAGGRALILDLRDNPGGLLNQAVEVADLFLSGGAIVSTRDRRGGERSFTAKPEKTVFLPGPGQPRPMAVLVNRESASASEIVAAALQDHGRAVVVGERTLGKGSVQKLLRLGSDPPAAVKLTTETYWRPSGKNIDRPRAPKDRPDEWGVSPDRDLEVPTTEAERVRYVIEMRRLGWVVGRPDVVGPNPLPPPPVPAPNGADGKPLYDDSRPFEDRVQQRAVEHLRKVLAGG